MSLSPTTRWLSLVLALAPVAACHTSSNNATPSPTVTPGTPLGSGSGGNGTTPSPDPGSTTTPPPSDGGVTTTPPSDGGTTTPPADLATAPGTDAGTGTGVPPLAHHRCGWMNDNPTLAKASLTANVDFFDAIHPYWWTLTTTGGVTATSWPDDATVVSTAQAHNIKLMPLVYGGNDATMIRSVISSSSAIAAHVQVLVNLAVTHHYDGIELDYEHLWAASDRAGYTALVTQLAAGLHAQGKDLSLAVPAIDVDNGQNGYDYQAIVAGGVDIVHLMGYDFHDTTSHLGPLAPLGWIDAVNARVQQLGLQSHFILGIGNYGIGSGWYANSADAITMCGAGYPTTTNHMLTCPFGNYNAGTSPHCTTSQGDIWFEDQTSMTEKASSAKAHGLRGVTYYDLGGEAPGLFTALRSAYPQ